MMNNHQKFKENKILYTENAHNFCFEDLDQQDLEIDPQQLQLLMADQNFKAMFQKQSDVQPLQIENGVYDMQNDYDDYDYEVDSIDINDLPNDQQNYFLKEEDNKLEAFGVELVEDGVEELEETQDEDIGDDLMELYQNEGQNDYNKFQSIHIMQLVQEEEYQQNKKIDEEEERYTCPMTGAHFEYIEMLRRLKRLQKRRNIIDQLIEGDQSDNNSEVIILEKETIPRIQQKEAQSIPTEIYINSEEKEKKKVKNIQQSRMKQNPFLQQERGVEQPIEYKSQSRKSQQQQNIKYNNYCVTEVNDDQSKTKSRISNQELLKKQIENQALQEILMQNYEMINRQMVQKQENKVQQIKKSRSNSKKRQISNQNQNSNQNKQKVQCQSNVQKLLMNFQKNSELKSRTQNNKNVYGGKANSKVQERSGYNMSKIQQMNKNNKYGLVYSGIASRGNNNVQNKVTQNQPQQQFQQFQYQINQGQIIINNGTINSSNIVGSHSTTVGVSSQNGSRPDSTVKKKIGGISPQLNNNQQYSQPISIPLSSHQSVNYNGQVDFKNLLSKQKDQNNKSKFKQPVINKQIIQHKKVSSMISGQNKHIKNQSNQFALFDQNSLALDHILSQKLDSEGIDSQIYQTYHEHNKPEIFSQKKKQQKIRTKSNNQNIKKIQQENIKFDINHLIKNLSNKQQVEQHQKQQSNRKKNQNTQYSSITYNSNQINQQKQNYSKNLIDQANQKRYSSIKHSLGHIENKKITATGNIMKTNNRSRDSRVRGSNILNQKIQTNFQKKKQGVKNQININLYHGNSSNFRSERCETVS